VGEEPQLGHETIIPVPYDNSYRMVTVSTRSRKRVELGGCG
jgi:hypothetical protein